MKAYPYCWFCGRKRTRIRDAGGGFAYRWQGLDGSEGERHETCFACRSHEEEAIRYRAIKAKDGPMAAIHDLQANGSVRARNNAAVLSASVNDLLGRE